MQVTTRSGRLGAGRRIGQEPYRGDRRGSTVIAKRLSALEKKLDVALKDAEEMLAEIRAINRK